MQWVHHGQKFYLQSMLTKYEREVVRASLDVQPVGVETKAPAVPVVRRIPQTDGLQ